MSDALRRARAQPLDDVDERCAGGEDLGGASLFQGGDLGLGDDPAPEEDDVGGVPGVERGAHGGKKRVVCTGQNGETDKVDVLLHGGLGHHLRALVKAGVNHLHPRVPKRPGDDLGTPIVAVEPGFGDQDADAALVARKLPAVSAIKNFFSIVFYSQMILPAIPKITAEMRRSKYPLKSRS